MLLPVVFAVSLVTHMNSPENVKRAPLLPWFAVAFAALVLINSAGWISPSVQAATGEISRWCLVIAIAAIGVKTSLKELSLMGARPIALIVGETVFLAALVIIALYLMR
jgi:uncharacterized membrane protein YadS